MPPATKLVILGVLPEEGGSSAHLILIMFIFVALVALNELGIEVEKYYASEIDEDALMVSNCCHPYKITHLGDIKNITSEKLEEIPAIHILLGGSPCNDMSSVNPSKKGLTGKPIMDFNKLKVRPRPLNLSSYQKSRTFGPNDKYTIKCWRLYTYSRVIPNVFL